MNRFVLDTSVMVKWFSTFDEADTRNALWLRQALYENTCQIIIPDLVLYELGNALRYNPNFTAGDVTAAIYSLVEMNLTIRAVEPDILVEAIQLAYQYAVTLYDAYFLALAVKADLVLVTADYKFYQKVGDVKSVIRLNELLGEDQETIRV
jgi:predicted nucleic acid-binding protein